MTDLSSSSSTHLCQDRASQRVPPAGTDPIVDAAFYHGPGVRFQILEQGGLPAIFGVSLQMLFGMKLHSAGVAHPGHE